MVKQVDIGVIGIQGAISEHIFSMKKALKEENIKGSVTPVKNKKQLEKIKGLIIPGGESTTISGLIYNFDLYNDIKKRANNNDLAVMGTCAGCVILAEKLVDCKENIKPLELMNMSVHRNFFGSQKKSFEKKVDIKGFNRPFNAVFIRAPIIKEVRGRCKVLSKINGEIVMAKQDKFLALSFHPELTDDLRIHKYFLDLICS